MDNLLEKKVRFPKQTRSIETKNQIANTAQKLFGERGFYKTNSKEIAKEANVAIGSFYAYYNNKKEVFIDILKKHIDQLSLTITSSIETLSLNNYHNNKKSSKELISEFISNIIEAHDFDSQFHHEISVMIKSDEEVKKYYQQHEDMLRKYTFNFIKLFDESLKVKNVESASVLIYSAIDNFSHCFKITQDNKFDHSLINELTDMIYKYLFAK